ncbi:MAG: hypothetical protein R2784_19790 [Saprospiraceae bacterium]
MTILEKTGAQAFDKWEYKIFLLVSSIVAAFVISKMGMLPGMLILGLPVVIFVLNILIKKPLSAVWGSIFIGFFTAGLARYVSAPFGLLMDIILIAAWIGLIFKNKQTNIPWKNLKDSGYIVSGIWFLLVLLELGNPEMVSGMAWFYAMRAVGFYQMLVLGLVYLFVNDKSFLDKFLKVISWLSVAGTIWGLKQMIIGTDAAEEYWLFVEGYADTHVLVGVLRVFSFYSDAGQFGASQAQLALMAGIIAIGPGKWSTRLFYVFIALITFVGFGISGTRGALAVPAGGAIAYLVVSRNFKLLIAGILAMGISLLFKIFYALQGVEQVRRMRTALNVDDPSLQVRLQNQIKFGNYLASALFGGGIGSRILGIPIQPAIFGQYGNRFLLCKNLG